MKMNLPIFHSGKSNNFHKILHIKSLYSQKNIQQLIFKFMELEELFVDYEHINIICEHVWCDSRYVETSKNCKSTKNGKKKRQEKTPKKNNGAHFLTQKISFWMFLCRKTRQNCSIIVSVL